MEITSVLGFAGVATAMGMIAVAVSGAGKPQDPDMLEAMERAKSSSSLVESYLVRLSQPLVGSSVTSYFATTPTYAAIQSLLLAAGRPYGGSVEVFLATQVGAALLGCVGILLSLLVLQGAALAGALVLCGAITVFPWARTRDEAKKRSRLIDSQLPDFVELLLIRIGGGQSLRMALRRTAQMLDGPVAREMDNLLRLLDNQAGSDQESYSLIADSLGTPNARAFCSTLSQGDLEGTKMTAALTSLAASLRVAEFQRRRVENGKLPTKLVVIMSLHLMPLLFAVVIFPAVVAFGSLK